MLVATTKLQLEPLPAQRLHVLRGLTKQIQYLALVHFVSLGLSVQTQDRQSALDVQWGFIRQALEHQHVQLVQQGHIINKQD